MERRPLGRSGHNVTPVGFGSQTVGGLGYGDQNWRESEETVDAYLRSGGRFIDSARGYGVSEIFVGKRLQKFAQADEVFVCSKSGSTHPPIIQADMETSRFCLQRELLDVYYVHVPPPSFDALRRILDVYERFKKEGKIRLIGVSCRPLNTPEERDEVPRYFEDGRIDVLQFPYSFALPEVGALISEAHRRGVGAVVRQALEGGMFTDKFMPGHRFTDTANDWRAGVPADSMEQALRLIHDIRQRFVRPPYTCLAQLGLSFVLRHPGVSATIPGAGSVHEMRENLSVNDLPPMPDDLAKDLVEAARPVLALLRGQKK